MGGRVHLILVLSLSLTLCLFSQPASAQLKRNFYASICPNVDVEGIVTKAVKAKFGQTFVTVPATIRLFFHDCFVQGCDASIMIQSTDTNTAEKDNEDNISLAGDGFDTVIKAKAAIEQSTCKNKVSCADVLALATRDVIALSGGPSYAVELGRLDGFTSTAASVTGKLPHPNFSLSQLNSMFLSNGLTQTDMIALSAAHTVGFSHCSKFANRIYNFTSKNPVDPTLDKTYANQLKGMCPKNVDPSIAINMDPTSPRKFDNVYFLNLQQRKGLFTSDQVLFEDTRSRPTVNTWASSSTAFNNAFITAITKLGRVGVKTGKVGVNGKIRKFCDVL